MHNNRKLSLFPFLSFLFFFTTTHLHLSGLILFEDEAELVGVRPCDQPQEKRMVTLGKLLEQSCGAKNTQKEDEIP